MTISPQTGPDSPGLLPAPVPAIIVHFRTPEETVAAARAALENGCSVLIIDNASGDGISQRLEREAIPARVLTEPRNRGYGAACNRGAAETAGAFLLFLNSDAFLAPGAVGALTRALEHDPQGAVVGPRLVSPQGVAQPSISRTPTLWRIFCESSGLAAIFGGRPPFRGHTKTAEDHSRPQTVESLMGAALLVRRTAFEDVGGFDEDFFFYAEEADLAARLRKRGYRILYDPSARAVHVGGASGGDVLFGQLLRSLRLYARKHQGALAGMAAAAILWGGALARYLLALVTPGETGRRRRRRYGSALWTLSPATRASSRSPMR